MLFAGMERAADLALGVVLPGFAEADGATPTVIPIMVVIHQPAAAARLGLSNSG